MEPIERKWIGPNRLKNFVIFVITDWIINSGEHEDEILYENYLDSLIKMRTNVDQMNEIVQWVIKNWGYIENPTEILNHSIYDKIKDGVELVYNKYYSDMTIDNYEEILSKRYKNKKEAEEAEYKNKFGK